MKVSVSRMMQWSRHAACMGEFSVCLHNFSRKVKRAVSTWRPRHRRGLIRKYVVESIGGGRLNSSATGCDVVEGFFECGNERNIPKRHEICCSNERF